MYTRECPSLPSKYTRECPPSLLNIQGNALPPLLNVQGNALPPLLNVQGNTPPALLNLTRECPPSLLILQGTAAWPSLEGQASSFSLAGVKHGGTCKISRRCSRFRISTFKFEHGHACAQAKVPITVQTIADRCMQARDLPAPPSVRCHLSFSRGFIEFHFVPLQTQLYSAATLSIFGSVEAE